MDEPSNERIQMLVEASRQRWQRGLVFEAIELLDQAITMMRLIAFKLPNVKKNNFRPRKPR